MKQTPVETIASVDTMSFEPVNARDIGEIYSFFYPPTNAISIASKASQFCDNVLKPAGFETTGVSMQTGLLTDTQRLHTELSTRGIPITSVDIPYILNPLGHPFSRPINVMETITNIAYALKQCPNRHVFETKIADFISVIRTRGHTEKDKIIFRAAGEMLENPGIEYITRTIINSGVSSDEYIIVVEPDGAFRNTSQWLGTLMELKQDGYPVGISFDGAGVEGLEDHKLANATPGAKTLHAWQKIIENAELFDMVRLVEVNLYDKYAGRHSQIGNNTIDYPSIMRSWRERYNQTTGSQPHFVFEGNPFIDDWRQPSAVEFFKKLNDD